MEIAPRISVDEKIRFGKPVITGTRVPVHPIIGKLAGGITYEEVIAEYEITRKYHDGRNRTLKLTFLFIFHIYSFP